MSFRSLTLIFVLLLSSGAVNSQGFTVYGARGCGSLIGSIESTNKYEKDLAASTTKNWIGGFLSAYNSWYVVIYKTPSVLGSSDLDGAYMSVVNYCRANPLKDISDAMFDTVNSLLPPVPSSGNPPAKKR
jgi:hypothetical protein